MKLNSKRNITIFCMIYTIYIHLMNEGVDVLRSAQGEHMGGMVYRILPNQKYDQEDEQWQFFPGTLVHCIYKFDNGNRIIVANREVDK